MKGLKSVATLRPFKLTLCSLRHEQLKAAYNAIISCLGLLVYSPHQEKTYFLKFDLHLKTSFQFSKINSHIDVLSSNGKKRWADTTQISC